MKLKTILFTKLIIFVSSCATYQPRPGYDSKNDVAFPSQNIQQLQNEQFNYFDVEKEIQLKQLELEQQRQDADWSKVLECDPNGCVL